MPSASAPARSRGRNARAGGSRKQRRATVRLNSEAALLNGAGGAARSYVSSAARKCAGARELYHVVHEGLAAERTSPGRAQPRPDLGEER